MNNTTLSDTELKLLKDIKENSKNNVLVICDLHEPFCLDTYFDFSVETKERYNCGTVVFIGDIIDNHYSSYHESDADSLGTGDELSLAVSKIKKWHKAFPNATVVTGNHDRIIHRKAFSAGLSKRWIRDYKEVFETPTWTFTEEIGLDGVVYVHGEGGTVKT